jgi:NAD(P)-dependent dehydrogenase (short-subunit alcohol dehydrogenase family)
MENLEDKVAVVTGGASGIGLAMARAFAGAGMDLAIADIEEEPMAKAAAELEGLGAEVLTSITDVRDHRAVDAFADATFDRFGAAHVVCNNAGVHLSDTGWQFDPERFRWVVEINLLGVAWGLHAFVPRLIEQGEGHIVNTASAAGLVTGPTMASYFASKHGVVALTEALANDLALAGHAAIGVSVLCPEYVATNINRSARLQPPGADVDRGEMAAASRQLFDEAVDQGIDPAVVADKVLHAVRNNEFWILPHDTTLDLAKTRWEKIAEGKPPFLWG